MFGFFSTKKQDTLVLDRIYDSYLETFDCLVYHIATDPDFKKWAPHLGTDLYRAEMLKLAASFFGEMARHTSHQGHMLYKTNTKDSFLDFQERFLFAVGCDLYKLKYTSECDLKGIQVDPNKKITQAQQSLLLGDIERAMKYCVWAKKELPKSYMYDSGIILARMLINEDNILNKVVEVFNFVITDHNTK